MKKKGIIALLVVIVLFVSAFVVDVVKSKQYDFELISNPQMKFVADGQSTAKITVKLSKNDKPVEGHTIYIYASNGTLPQSRCVTDVDGLITFKYYPYVYLSDELTPLEDVTIYLQDESNSTVFMVTAKAQFTFKAVKPENEDSWKDWQHLGEESDG